MKLRRKLLTIRTAPPERTEYKLWRKADYESLSPEHRPRARRFERVIKLYIGGRSLRHLARISGFDSKSIVRAFDRCVTLAPDGQPYGWIALEKYFRVNPMVRFTPIKPEEGGRGYAGAFAQLLNTYPKLRHLVIQRVLRMDTKRPYEKRELIKVIYPLFLKWCAEVGVPITAYPLCRKGLARRSLGRLIDIIRAERWRRALSTEGRSDAAHRLNVGGDEEARILAVLPYDAVQIDEHRLHCVGTVRIKTPAGWRFVPLIRVSIITITDVVTRAILGYYLVIRKEAKAWHLTAARKHALSRWEPKELTITGLQYKPGAGLPSSIDPALEGAAWAQELLDNALIHLSEESVTGAAERLGVKINFGAVGAWEKRPIAEMIHRKLERYGFSRLVSSTGTGPEDPTIEDANAAAVKYKLELHELIQFVDVVVANVNAEQNEGIAHKSPLDLMREYLAAQDTLFMPRKLPPLGEFQSDLGIIREKLTVCGSRDGGRRPYVQKARNIYTSAILKSAVSLIGQKLTCHVNRKDISTIRAFHPDGRELGVLRAKGAWGRHPHTLEERELFNSLIGKGELKLEQGQDEVEALHTYLANKAVKDAERQSDRRPRTSKSATQVAEIQIEGTYVAPLKKKPRDSRPTSFPLRGFEYIKHQAGSKS